MFNTARTTAEFLMPGDRIKVGGRFMIIAGIAESIAGNQIVYVRTPNSGSSTMTLTPNPSDKFKVYNARKQY